MGYLGFTKSGRCPTHRTDCVRSCRRTSQLHESRRAGRNFVADHESDHKLRLKNGFGVRLFNRTTRSVAFTEAGNRLLAEVRPILEGIDHAIENVNSFRDKPIGRLRLAIERPASAILRASSFWNR